MLLIFSTTLADNSIATFSLLQAAATSGSTATSTAQAAGLLSMVQARNMLSHSVECLMVDRSNASVSKLLPVAKGAFCCKSSA